MKTIKVTPALRSAIYQAARKEVSGGSPFFEVGFREKVFSSDRCFRSTPARVCGDETTNMRLWEEDADLIDMIPLKELKTLELDEGGLCELDLYATTTQAARGSFMGGRQLETNVYVMLDETGVLDTSSVGSDYRKTWEEPKREAPARLRPSELRVGMVAIYGYTVTGSPGHSSPGGRIIVPVRYPNGDEGVREWDHDEPCIGIQPPAVGPVKLRPSEMRPGMVTVFGYEVLADPVKLPDGGIAVRVRYLDGGTGTREWNDDTTLIELAG